MLGLPLHWGPWRFRYIATDLAQQVLANEQFKAAVIGRTPAGRVGEPHEVAGAT